MAYCTKCGKEVGNHKFCPYCGTKLRRTEEKSENKDNSPKKSYWWVWLVIGLLVIIGGYTYCNQMIPVEVQDTYTEQEPYTVYETRTRIQEVVESGCDDDPDCVCTGRYFGLFGCSKCDCEITESVPVTKYREVEKTRTITKNVKRCSFLR